MADFWTTPKVDWVANDGIGYEDLNRIEQNTEAIRNATYRKVQGFGYSVDNTPADGTITVNPGSCFDINGIPIERSLSITKNLNAWVEGSGASIGGLAPFAVLAADTWYYLFIIMNQTAGTTDLMIDDNAAGTNVINGIYTIKRFINTVKSGSIAGDDLKFIEMYSTGGDVFINPNSMYPTTRYARKFTNTVPKNNNYALEILGVGADRSLPARIVTAHLNCLGAEASMGLVNAVGGFAATGYNIGGLVTAEYSQGQIATIMSADPSLLISAAGEFYLALFDPIITDGDVEIAVIGYTDTRLIE